MMLLTPHPHHHHHPQQSGCRACSDVVLYFSSYASEEIDMDSHTCSPVYQTSQTNKCFITKTNHILQGFSLFFFYLSVVMKRLSKVCFEKEKVKLVFVCFNPLSLSSRRILGLSSTLQSPCSYEAASLGSSMRQ